MMVMVVVVQVANCKDTRTAREALYKKLESAGHDVGRRVAESYVPCLLHPLRTPHVCSSIGGLPVHVHLLGSVPCLCRLTRDYNTIGDTLEVVKFVCRELWMHLFGKPITQLQTNRRVRVWHQTPHTSSARPLMSLLACLVLPGCVCAP